MKCVLLAGKDSDNNGIIIAVIFRKVYQVSHIFRKKIRKTQIKFGFSFDLHYLCTVILKRVNVNVEA